MNRFDSHRFVLLRVRRSARRGMVLVVVLLVIAILGLAAGTFCELMISEREAAQLAARQAQARALAESGIEMTRLFLSQEEQAQLDLGGWYDNPQRFQAALTLEPTNELALKRIDEMKTFYHEHGQKYFSQKKWTRALSHFERYYLIDTENKEINNKMIVCREKLAQAKVRAQKPRPAVVPAEKKPVQKQDNNKEKAGKREEIKRLLEESGTESSWIMKYLFEDQKSGINSEKPW